MFADHNCKALDLEPWRIIRNRRPYRQDKRNLRVRGKSTGNLRGTSKPERADR